MKISRSKRTPYLQPMRIQARQGSKAERLYYRHGALPGQKWSTPKAIAPGIRPDPLFDLIYHGGKLVPQMEFQNIYLGGTDAWSARDMEFIDRAITQAMQYTRLNNVMAQYFPGAELSCDPRSSIVDSAPAPSALDEPDVKAKVTALLDAGTISDSDLDTTVFNLILPPGAVLKLGDVNSLNGLGGYHGSTHVRRKGKTVTVYYSADVYSQTSNGRENGIDVFDAPWKNVVGTLFHEINEFRTDADVGDAIAQKDNQFLGWNSRQGLEVGDRPIAEANPLTEVFQEVTSGKRRIPVQFLWSNAVHGPEGPISAPHGGRSPA